MHNMTIRNFTTDTQGTTLKKGDSVATTRTGRYGEIVAIYTCKANGVTWHDLEILSRGNRCYWDAADVIKR